MVSYRWKRSRFRVRPKFASEYLANLDNLHESSPVICKPKWQQSETKVAIPVADSQVGRGKGLDSPGKKGTKKGRYRSLRCSNICNCDSPRCRLRCRLGSLRSECRDIYQIHRLRMVWGACAERTQFVQAEHHVQLGVCPTASSTTRNHVYILHVQTCLNMHRMCGNVKVSMHIAAWKQAPRRKAQRLKKTK